MSIRPLFIASRHNGVETYRFPEVRRSYIIRAENRRYTLTGIGTISFPYATRRDAITAMHDDVLMRLD